MFELVLAGGRVIDPETGLDETRDVGITGGRIGAVSREPLAGTQVIDVAGQVVAPGFIDLHSHAQDLLGQRLQALDGVTTALELEAGTLPVGATLAHAAAQGRVINFGYSASWALARAELLDDADLSRAGGAALSYLTGPGWGQPASEKHISVIEARLDEALGEGAIGIGVLLGYAPGTAPAEYRRIAQLAARRGVPVFTHARWIARSGPHTSLDGATEVIAAGRDTGAHMHVCHINSTSDVMIGQVADAISAARADGVIISTEAYPYGASSTIIGSPFFDPEALRRRGQSPRALTYLATGERVASVERLLELRATDPAGLVIFDWLDLEAPADLAMLDRSLLLADTAMASDALPALVGGQAADPQAWPAPPGARAHPRMAGTFARTFGWLVRERGLLTLAEAVRRCTLLPASILAAAAPAMARKGRLQPGCDADVVVFDPAVIADRATYTQLRPSTGISHVLVGGVPVVTGGQLVQDARPGQAVRGRGH